MRSALSEAQLALSKTRNAPVPRATWNNNLWNAEKQAGQYFGKNFQNFVSANQNQAKNQLNPYGGAAVKQGQQMTQNLPGFINQAMGQQGGGYSTPDIWKQAIHANPFLYQQGSNPMDLAQQNNANPFAWDSGTNPMQFANQSNVYNFSPNQTLGKMMSATPDMDIYGPLMQQISDQGAKSFMEQIAPTIRTDAMSVGGYGGSRQGLALGQAAERVGGQVADAQTRLAAQAASEALGQRATGAQLASGLAQHQSGLLGQLGSQQAAQQAGFAGQTADINAQMAAQQAAQRAGFAGQTADIQSQLAQRQADLIGQNNALTEQQRASMMNEGLSAGQLGADFYTQNLGNAFDASGRAMALAPGLGAMGQLPIDMQMRFGDMKNQQKVAYEEARRNAPWQPVSNFANIAASMGGQGGVSTTPYTTNPLMSGLGGAAMGGSLFGPWGALAGGALGLFS